VHRESGRYDHAVRIWSLGLLLVVASGLATGCSTSQPPRQTSVAVESQVKTALAWFQAVNQKDKPLAVAHFAPGDRGQMNWGDGSTSGWPRFSNVHCRALAHAGPQVLCPFKESDAPDVGNPDSFWTISFVRTSSTGPWLISGYGQG
jgi:hypothetical protein